MIEAGSAAAKHLCAGIQSFVINDVGVKVIPMGVEDGIPRFDVVCESDCTDLESLSQAGEELLPYAMKLSENPSLARPGLLGPHFRHMVGIFEDAKSRVGRIQKGKKHDEMIRIQAGKEARRGSDLVASNRGFMAADSYLRSGAIYMSLMGKGHDGEMVEVFDRGASNYLGARQSVLAILSLELAARFDPSRIGEFGGKASRLWLEVKAMCSNPEDRYLAIGQGLHVAWRAAAWKSVVEFLDALAKLEFDGDHFSNAAEGQLRCALVESMRCNGESTAMKLEEAITTWELSETHAEHISRANKLIDEARAIR